MAIFRRKDKDSNGGRHRDDAGRRDDLTAATARESDVAETDELESDAAETGSGDLSEGEVEGEGVERATASNDADPDADPDADDDGGDDVGGVVATRRRSAPVDRSEGPFDESEVDGADGRLDLGALWLGGRPGMELRLEMDQETQTMVGVTAAIGDSAVQLQAFAAPKSSGIWDDVRTEIADSIVAQGGTADETDGDLGIELQARMPGRGPDGRTVFSPVRFVGVDGPRWFLRGVLSGKAGSDPVAGADLLALVRETVVVRGGEAMAPRELLGLRLPEELTTTPEDEADQSEDDGEDDELKPFERGPEITEIH